MANLHIVKLAESVQLIASTFGNGGTMNEALIHIKQRLYQSLTSFDQRLSSFEEHRDKALTAHTKSVSDQIIGLEQKIQHLASRPTTTTVSHPPLPPPARRVPPPVVTLSHDQVVRERDNSQDLSQKCKTVLNAHIRKLTTLKPSQLVPILQSQEKIAEEVKADPKYISPEDWFADNTFVWSGVESMALDVNTIELNLGKGKNSPSKKQNQTAAPAPTPTNTPPQKPVKSNSQKAREDFRKRQVLWIVKHPEPIPESERLKPTAVWSKIQLIDHSKFPVKYQQSSWTKDGRVLFLHFSPDTNDEFVETQGIHICQALGFPGATMQRAVKTSKIMLAHIPCCNLENPDVLITNEQLCAELSTHDFFKDLIYTQGPKWVTPDMENKEVATAFIKFQDPEGNYARTILNYTIFLFGHFIIANVPLDKVDITQCSRCWNFGKEHKTCAIRCVYCGAVGHTAANHIDFCKDCHQMGQKDINSCSHLCCPNCKKEHSATEVKCLSCAQYISAERQKKGGQKKASFHS